MEKSPLKLPSLGEVELAVLEHLWSVRDSDVNETHAILGKKRGISPKREQAKPKEIKDLLNAELKRGTI